MTDKFQKPPACPVFACFFGDGEIVGFTKTAEEACAWASAVAANNKSVRIIQIYEMKGYNRKEAP